jgi:hypothetical protein
MFCRECSFTNKIFKIRTMKLKNGNAIQWQSILERRFIEWCEEKGVDIKNGPTLPYMLNGARKKYKVDFELPTQKKLVEIKDNHCWHQQQVALGKFAEKNSVAEAWCREHGYSYHILFPKDMSAFKDSVRYSLNSMET